MCETVSAELLKLAARQNHPPEVVVAHINGLQWQLAQQLWERPIYLIVAYI